MGLDKVTPFLPIAGDLINGIMQSEQNRKTREWNEKMYNIQRGHSLEDWNRQNEYNHPSQQMARLREAGLNPNLVYGTGAVANSPTMNRPVDVKSWNPTAPRFGSGLMEYVDAKMKVAQTDNLREQNNVLVKEGMLKSAQTLSTLANTKIAGKDFETKEFNLELEKSLRDMTVANRRLALEKLEADIDQTLTNKQYTINEDERKEAMNAVSIKEAATRILQMRLNMTKVPHEIEEIKARIENIKSSTKLNQFESSLNEYGMTKHDAGWWRALRMIIGNPTTPKNMLDPIGEIIEEAKRKGIIK